MGAKQSTADHFDGRTRAYSSSDLPSGTASEGHRIGFRYTNGPDGPRIRYTAGGGGIRAHSAVTIPGHNNNRSAAHGLDEEEEDIEEDSQLSIGGQRLLIGSLPAHLSPHLLGGFHCPVCTKYVDSDEMEKHLFACFTKTSLSYNKDILSRDSGECSICLDELEQGDTIARLPCLCIYHKGCIDEWFEVNRSCPAHPTD